MGSTVKIDFAESFSFPEYGRPLHSDFEQ